MPKRLLLLSTSTIHGSEFLGYCRNEVKAHFQDAGEILFIPYARPGGISWEDYTALVSEKLVPLNLGVKGIHEFPDPGKAVEQAKGIYIGGGNTFLLLKTLYDFRLPSLIRQRVLEENLPYMGSSAGTNVACPAINNTNDMPIVYPPTFEAMRLVPFNINPHYLDPDPHSTHKGETRETRIREFHFQSKLPVVGLREGSWLDVQGDQVVLCGNLTARIFEAGKEPYELESGRDLNFLA